MGTALKNIKGKEGYKVVTVVLPPALANYLTLFTFAHSISKTSLLIASIEEWMADNIENNPRDKLLKLIAENALHNWKRKKSKKQDSSLRTFRAEMIYELEWKGFTEEQIREILITFNNGTR